MFTTQIELIRISKWALVNFLVDQLINQVLIINSGHHLKTEMDLKCIKNKLYSTSSAKLGLRIAVLCFKCSAPKFKRILDYRHITQRKVKVQESESVQLRSRRPPKRQWFGRWWPQTTALSLDLLIPPQPKKANGVTTSPQLSIF